MNGQWYDGTWIQTHRGHRFELSAPTPAMVDIMDLAHHLSQECRYAGAPETMYSVAQHSVLASLHVERLRDPVMLQRWALLHDTEEAYVKDLPRPLKKILKARAPGAWDSIARPIRDAIMTKFGLPLEEPIEVKCIDRRLCVTEKRDVLRQPLKGEDAGIEPIHATITPWPSKVAEIMFLKRFQELWG